MLTLVHVRPSHAASREIASREAAALTADYLSFDRRRIERRQYLKAFGGIAVVVLLGAAFGRVPMDEASIVVSLLLVVPVVLAILEASQWRRLARRLDAVRGKVQTIRKS